MRGIVMTVYQKYGRPGWQSQCGQKSGLDNSRRESLVRKGLASWWLPLRNVKDAVRKAGI